MPWIDAYTPSKLPILTSRTHFLGGLYPYIGLLWVGAAAGCVVDYSDLTAGRGNADGGDVARAGRGGSTMTDIDASARGGAGGAVGGNGGASAAGNGGGGVGNDGSVGSDRDDGSARGGASGSGGAAGTGGAPTDDASGTGGSDMDGAGGSAGAAGASGAGGASGGAAGNAGNAGTGGGGPIDGGQDAPIATGAVFSVGSFVKSSAVGPQVVAHTLGQTPKALLLWTAGKTNETLSAGFFYGIGVSDGATSISLAMSTRDAVTTSSSSRRIASKVITLVQGGEITVAEADLSSMGVSSVTLNWTTNDGQPYVIHYLAIGGPEVSAKLVNWQAPATTGPKAVTGFGFQPETVLHFHTGGAFVATPPSSLSNGVIGMGVMNKSGAQWAVQVADATALSPTVATRAQRTDAAIFMYHAPAAVVNKAATFVSMDADGFTLNFSTATSDLSQVVSLALAGLQSSVGTFTKSTAVAPASQAVSTPFTPGAVFLSSYQIAPQTAAVRESQCSWGVGASDGQHEGSSAIVATDAVSTTSVDAVDRTSKVFIKMNSPPVDAEADLSSFDPSGFTLSWTTNDPVASQICFLALGKQ